ncbi:unnamed protein product [Sphacelaria rigidula]
MSALDTPRDGSAPGAAHGRPTPSTSAEKAEPDHKRGRRGEALKYCGFVASQEQDILEHRLAHIRGGVGSHWNPTREQAMSAGSNADVARAFHGGQRRNSSRADPKRGNIDFLVDLAGTTATSVLPVNAAERKMQLRSPARDGVGHVIGPRAIDWIRPDSTSRSSRVGNSGGNL